MENKGKMSGGRKKLRIHSKVCSRCSGIYSTPSKYSKVCESCQMKRGKKGKNGNKI